MNANETVWGSLEDIRNGALDNLNIGWYHVFASGQTVLCVHNGPPNLVRHPTNAARLSFPGRSFETSISSFKNRNRLAHNLVRWRMLAGILPKDHTEIQQAKARGLVSRRQIIGAPSFKDMHARIMAQIATILQDKPQFRDDSRTNESRKIMSDSIALIQARFQWDPSELSAILQQCLDDYFVRNVMDS